MLGVYNTPVSVFSQVIASSASSYGVYAHTTSNDFRRYFEAQIVYRDISFGNIIVTFVPQRFEGHIQYTREFERVPCILSFNDYDTYKQNIDIAMGYLLTPSVNPMPMPMPSPALSYVNVPRTMPMSVPVPVPMPVQSSVDTIPRTMSQVTEKIVSEVKVAPAPAPVSEKKVVKVAPVSEEKMVKEVSVSEEKMVKEVRVEAIVSEEDKLVLTLEKSSPLKESHELRDFKRKSFYDGKNVGKKIGPELNSQLRKAKSLTENIISEHKKDLEDGKKVLNLYRELGLNDKNGELFLFDKLVLGDVFYEYLNDYVHSKGLKLTCDRKKLLIHSRYMVLG